jgi:hypothetical protein
MSTTIILHLEICAVIILALHPQLSVNQVEAVLQHLKQNPYIPKNLLEHWLNNVIKHLKLIQ